MTRARTGDAEGAPEPRQQRLPLAWQTPGAEGAAPAEPQGPAAPAPAQAGAAGPAPAPGGPAPEPPAAGPGSAPAEPGPALAAAPRPGAAQAPLGGAGSPGGVPPQEGDAEGAGAAGRIGELLSSARAAAGLSTTEVSRRTCIPRTLIEQLEANAFDQLPQEFHCVNHVRKLCELYNVDPEPYVARLREDLLRHRGREAGPTSTMQVVTTDSAGGPVVTYVPPGPRIPRRVWESWTRVAVSAAIVLFFVIALLALAVQHFRHRNGGEPGPAKAAQPASTAAVDLKEFMTPEPLEAYELPIPDK